MIIFLKLKNCNLINYWDMKSKTFVRHLVLGFTLNTRMLEEYFRPFFEEFKLIKVFEIQLSSKYNFFYKFLKWKI